MSFLATKTARMAVCFLVLEEDSLDIEDIPFGDCFLASDLGIGLARLSLLAESVLCFGSALVLL